MMNFSRRMSSMAKLFSEPREILENIPALLACRCLLARPTVRLRWSAGGTPPLCRCGYGTEPARRRHGPGRAPARLRYGPANPRSVAADPPARRRHGAGTSSLGPATELYRPGTGAGCSPPGRRQATVSASQVCRWSATGGRRPQDSTASPDDLDSRTRLWAAAGRLRAVPSPLHHTPHSGMRVWCRGD